MKNIIALGLSVFVLAGCSSGAGYEFCSIGNVSTELNSYKAPQLPKKILMNTNRHVSDLFCPELEKQGIECQPYDYVISPLKRNTLDEVKALIRDSGFDGVLEVRASGDNSQSWNAGSVTNFNASSLGNNVSGYATTTNFNGYSRTTQYELQILNTQDFERVYVADAVTSGSGSACVVDYVFTRSLAESVAKDLATK